MQGAPFAGALASSNRRKSRNAKRNGQGLIQLRLFAIASVIAICMLGEPARSENLAAPNGDQPERLDSVLRAGDQARTAGEPSSAEAFYKQATVLNSRSIDAWLRLGAVQLHSNELYAAAQSYRAAQAIDDKNLDAALALGQIALRLGNSRAAVEELEVGLRSHANDPQLNYAAGIAYAAQRNFDIALEHYRTALAYDPQNILIRTDYGLLQLQTGDAEAARETLEAVSKSSQATGRARLVLALSYMALGRTSDALSTVPNVSESELRHLFSEYYPQAVPNRAAGEQHLVPQNHADDVPTAERSANPEREAAEQRGPEKTVATSGSGSVASNSSREWLSFDTA